MSLVHDFQAACRHAHLLGLAHVQHAVLRPDRSSRDRDGQGPDQQQTTGKEGRVTGGFEHMLPRRRGCSRGDSPQRRVPKARRTYAEGMDVRIGYPSDLTDPQRDSIEHLFPDPRSVAYFGPIGRRSRRQLRDRAPRATVSCGWDPPWRQLFSMKRIRTRTDADRLKKHIRPWSPEADPAPRPSNLGEGALSARADAPAHRRRSVGRRRKAVHGEGSGMPS